MATVNVANAEAHRQPGVGNHISFIFEDVPQFAAFLAPYITSGLAERQRCVYVYGELEPHVVTRALIGRGVDVKREIERGALILVRAREYYAPSPFDAARVIEVMRRRQVEARSRGFTGLRIAGDMTWTLQGGLGDEALLEYESLLDGTGIPSSVAMACFYRRDRFHPMVLERLIAVAGEWLPTTVCS